MQKLELEEVSKVPRAPKGLTWHRAAMMLLFADEFIRSLSRKGEKRDLSASQKAFSPHPLVHLCLFYRDDVRRYRSAYTTN